MSGEKVYNPFDFEEAIKKDIEERRKNNTGLKKIKYFVEDNIEVIGTVLTGVSCAMLGCIIGCKATTKAIGKGLDVYNNVGFIRYFDRDGKEIFGDDATRRAMEIAEDIRHK